MFNSKINIAYLSSSNPKDVHAWSGIHYSILNALEKNVGKVSILGPYENKLINLIIKLRKVFYSFFLKERYNKYHSSLLAKAYGRYFNLKIKNKSYDFIIAVSASAELAYLQTEIPVVFVSDALFTNATNYYVTLSNLCAKSLKEGYDIELKALNKASFLYVPSDWVKQAAINDFKIAPVNIEVSPLGANLESIPNKEFILNYKSQKNNAILNLIFVGVNWDNKGGLIAYNCLLKLIELGQNAQLTVVGCKVPENIKHNNVINIPFIKKTNEEGRKQFENLYLNADFLILPTKFEAFGIVFCEAAAHGVISLATNTGGTPSSIKENVNGFLLPPESNGNDYAYKILEIYTDKIKFNNLILSSLNRYEKELNWDSWAINLKNSLLSRKIID